LLTVEVTYSQKFENAKEGDDFDFSWLRYAGPIFAVICVFGY